MNTIRAKSRITDEPITDATWANATSLAESIKSACASFGKDYEFTVALVGEKNTSTEKDGTITIKQGLAVNSKIKFETHTWKKMQALEDSIQSACAAVSSDYTVKTYTNKEFN